MALALPASADDALKLVQGLWGWEFAPDMTCEENPHQISYDPASRRLTFEWRSPVTYADGTVSTGDDFDVTAVIGKRVEITRRRDGFKGALVLSPDGKSYVFGAATDGDPSFDFPYGRCSFVGF